MVYICKIKDRNYQKLSQIKIASFEYFENAIKMHNKIRIMMDTGNKRTNRCPFNCNFNIDVFQKKRNK